MAVSPPINPILTYLPLNGNLAGRDRNGVFTATGAGALRWQPAEGARVNHCLNSRFSTNTTYWGTNGGGGNSITRIADDRFSDGFAARVVVVGGQPWYGIVGGASTSILNSPAASDTYITVSFDIVVESGPTSGLEVGIQSLTADAVTLLGGPITTFNVASTNTLYRISKTLSITPMTYSGSLVRFYLGVGQIASAQWIISNVCFEYGSVANATYFDGSYPGCSWINPRTGVLGTAHASPSCNQVTAWIEEGTTNLLLNPSVEHATNAYAVSAVNSAIITKDTTTAYLGAASAKIVTPGSVTLEGVAWQTSVSLGFTGASDSCIGSFYHKGVGNFNRWLRVLYTDATSVDSSVTTFTGSSSWQRITTPTLTLDPSKTVNQFFLMCRTFGAQSITFHLDCGQVEKKAYATSYCDGSLGVGYSWSGTAHASSSTRSAGSISVAASGRAYESDGAAILKFSRLVNKGSQHSELLALGNYLSSPAAGQASQRLILDPATNKLVSTWSLNGAAYNAALYSTETFPTIASWYKAYTAWTVSAQKVSSLAGTPVSTSKASPTGTFVTNINIGWNSLGTNYTDGLVGPVAIFSRELTDTRRAMVNTAIDNYQDLWTLFEEWEGIIDPDDLLALQSGEATAGVSAVLDPDDFLTLQSGQATAGVAAEVAVLELGLDGESVTAVTERPFPVSVTWRVP